MDYRIGLDIGISSVGWSVLVHDKNENPYRIVDFGVRLFTPPENPKNGESPSVDRRNARGQRRLIRRKRQRLDRLKNALKRDLLDGQDIDFYPCDIYALRLKALDEKISDNDLARIIYSMAKHRGFRSNRKSEDKTGDNKKMLKQITQNSQKAQKYRSIGEMFCLDETYFENRHKIVGDEEKTFVVRKVRNKNGAYSNTFSRDDVVQEIRAILQKQRALGNEKLTDDFIENVVFLVEFQRSFDDGPSAPSKYRVDFAEMIGACTFYPNEKRAPKGAFSQEYFTALCDINNLKFDGQKITDEQRGLLENEFLKKKEVKFGDVRKVLGLSDGVEITGKSGSNKNERVFIRRPFSFAVLQALDLPQDPLSAWEIIDKIAYINSVKKSDENRQVAYENAPLLKDLPQKDALCALECSQFGNLSIKAIKEILPNLKKGMVYSDACAAAGLYLPTYQKSKKLKYGALKEIDELTSPVVIRAVSQTIKVVNAIIDKYGSPSAIFIELAREMGKNFQDRNAIKKQIEQNESKNEKYVEMLKELGISNPSGQDIVKIKLYEAQQGCCAYSGQSFESVLGSVKAIFENNNTQIDHIIPYSKCYNDSYNNKVLVLSSENQKKGNRTPYEYFGADKAKWDAFVNFCQVHYANNRTKFSNLMREHISDAEQQELNNRALNDTQYMARFLKNLFQSHLLFEESKKFAKKPVHTVNGSMTSFLRKVWGIKKERFADDKHHAVDAVLIGCTDDGMVQRVTRFLQTKNCIKRDGEDFFVDKSTGEIISVSDMTSQFGEKFQMPYENLKNEIEIRLSENVLSRKNELTAIGYVEEDFETVRPLFVSRMVNHKVTGAMHKDTIRSKKLMDENAEKLIVVTKTKIQDLKLDKFGEIAGYPQKFKQSDPALYKALHDRLVEFGGDGKKAFAEKFFKPTKTGLNQNEVRTVKIESVVSDGLEVNNGFAENSSMIRIDVFEKDGKNYFIPVYVSDFYKRRLPSRMSKAAKPYKDWPELDDTYNFKFSLFQNDLIKVSSRGGFDFVPCDKNAEKKPVKLNDLLVYYNGADRATASIIVETIDGKYQKAGMGILKLLTFEKYEIDLLGNIRKSGQEKRRVFTQKRR